MEELIQKMVYLSEKLENTVVFLSVFNKLTKIKRIGVLGRLDRNLSLQKYTLRERARGTELALQLDVIWDVYTIQDLRHIVHIIESGETGI